MGFSQCQLPYVLPEGENLLSTCLVRRSIPSTNISLRVSGAMSPRLALASFEKQLEERAVTHLLQLCVQCECHRTSQRHLKSVQVVPSPAGVGNTGVLTFPQAGSIALKLLATVSRPERPRTIRATRGH